MWRVYGAKVTRLTGRSDCLPWSQPSREARRRAVLSPLVRNVLLDELDKELERRGHRFVRYADDSNVYAQSKAAGERVMASLERFLEKRLRLRINRDNSAEARPWSRKFLGYSVTWHRTPKLRVAPQSVKRLKNKLRLFFRRARGRNLGQVIRELGPIIRGWVAYFRLSEVRINFELLDQWLRRKLRCILWRQWKRPKIRRKKLIVLGLDPARPGSRPATAGAPGGTPGLAHEPGDSDPVVATDGSLELSR